MSINWQKLTAIDRWVDFTHFSSKMWKWSFTYNRQPELNSTIYVNEKMTEEEEEDKEKE